MFDDFQAKFSVPAKHKDNAPTLEATAFVLASRRITRSTKHHGHRHVFLLDAKALIFALRKGRSSSAAFKTQLQKAGALHVCGDVQAVFGYIPTACNPGDPSSRGVRARANLVKKRCKSVKKPPEKWTVGNVTGRRALRHLRKTIPCGLRGSLRWKGDYTTSSSDSVTAQP